MDIFSILVVDLLQLIATGMKGGQAWRGGLWEKRCKVYIVTDMVQKNMLLHVE